MTQPNIIVKYNPKLDEKDKEYALVAHEGHIEPSLRLPQNLGDVFYVSNFETYVSNFRTHVSNLKTHVSKLET